MTVAPAYDDVAITDPAEDLFGLNGFSEDLADAVLSMDGRRGSVISINGPWGSGKSSLVNLMKHHLNARDKAASLQVVDFSCLWFRGEEALTVMFLRELESACARTLGRAAKDVLKRFRKKMISHDALRDFLSDLGESGIRKAATKYSIRYLDNTRSVEELFQMLGQLLVQQKKKILVVIDDIDRLTPDEQIQIFRLVKSVGRLPNVVYLLVFDRQLAEHAISLGLQTDGNSFLEKIVQVSFDIPPPERDVLNDALFKTIVDCCGEISNEYEGYFFNMFHGAMTRYVVLPRHMVRVRNTLKFAYGAVEGDVNVADFVVVQMLRLFEPRLFDVLRSKKFELCGVSDVGDQDGAGLNELLQFVTPAHQDVTREALYRLFPRLRDMGFSSDFLNQWEKNRQVCAERYFDTYFRMQLSESTITSSDLNALIERAWSKSDVQSTLLNACEQRRRNGKSMVPVWLEELQTHSDGFSPVDVEPFLAAVFEMGDILGSADTLDMRSDGLRNEHRLWWLTRKLLVTRQSLDDRSQLILEALRSAPVGWVAYVADRCRREIDERQKSDPSFDTLVSELVVADLLNLAVDKIRTSADNGSLIDHTRLVWLLYRWMEFAGDGGAAAKAWLQKQLNVPAYLPKILNGFIGNKFIQGMPMSDQGEIDYVGSVKPHVSEKDVSEWFDIEMVQGLIDSALQDLSLGEAERSVFLRFREGLSSDW